MTTTSMTAQSRVKGGLAARYRAVRSFTEQLAKPLSAEDQTVQTMDDVSPTKWHRAHTTWFFETFILDQYDRRYKPVDPSYGFLFNSYYEAVGSRHPRPQRGLLSRPGIAEIAAYREAVDEAMDTFMAAGIDDDRVADLIELGLHHEQQHQELLLMDIKHVLAINPLHPEYLPAPPSISPAPPARTWLDHPGGTVAVGHDAPGFAFDNETPRHDVLLAPFAVRTTLITCGEWLEFMADGGYERANLWMSDGWAAVQREGWQAPEYWQRGPDGWKLHTLYGFRPVDPAEPVVHVSWYEADAFARWAECRLPTEAEWEAVTANRLRPSLVGLDGAGVEAGGLHPAPAGAVGDDEQWCGAVWQWTSSPYAPYPGFRPAAGAVGEYNGKFMINQQTLRGSACITPAGHTRGTYRNFFYPSARWPFCGLRLAVDR